MLKPSPHPNQPSNKHNSPKTIPHHFSQSTTTNQLTHQFKAPHCPNYQTQTPLEELHTVTQSTKPKTEKSKANPLYPPPENHQSIHREATPLKTTKTTTTPKHSPMCPAVHVKVILLAYHSAKSGRREHQAEPPQSPPKRLQNPKSPKSQPRQQSTTEPASKPNCNPKTTRQLHNKASSLHQNTTQINQLHRSNNTSPYNINYVHI